MENFSYKDVVVIGNGPSGITLSYMLAGNWPFYNGFPHPIDFLQLRLEENSNKSIIEQDLQYLSEGLEGRSKNPVSVLFDTLNHPLADLGEENPTVLSWQKDHNHIVDHVVLGKGNPGGSWQKMDGNSLTISLGSWMELPSLSIFHWNENTKRLNLGQSGLRQKRATVHSVAKYYQHYVNAMNLNEYFVNDAVVTSVSRVMDTSSKSCNENVSKLWKVTGHIAECSKSCFTYVTPNVVLATGSSDKPNRLGVPGEDLPFVLYTLSELEEVINSGHLKSGNLMIVGAGLSAADAIIAARFHGIPIVHVFRRSVCDPELIFNKLPQNVYPEYHKVHQMMQNSNQERYAGYKAFPRYKVDKIESNHIVSLLPCNHLGSPYFIQVTYVLILTGMHPDLSILPNDGLNLGIHPNQPIHFKHNPIDIDMFSNESMKECGLYAVGPLVGDNFVRFVQGGCLAAVSHIWKNHHKLSSID